MSAQNTSRRNHLDWVKSKQIAGTTTDEALSFFDSLEPVQAGSMFGCWKGSGLPTGHPQDGMLELLGWYGKEFIDAERVHPLLFGNSKEELIALDANRILLNLALGPYPLPAPLTKWVFPIALLLFSTQSPRARLRMTEFRGKVSATMIYDYLPINDVFRRLDEDHVLGLMDQRGAKRPFFFVLSRDGAVR